MRRTVPSSDPDLTRDLITIMLLGHWQEMEALGQARSALAGLAEFLPDDAERVGSFR
jgi:hypothetical protein